MASEIDLHVGRRLRRRRRLLGLTQQQVGAAVGIRFQQVQKYESGANRLSAARLFELARALNVPIQYFYDGLDEADGAGPMLNGGDSDIAPNVLSRNETLELVRVYYRLAEEPRRRLLDLARSLNDVVKSNPG